MILLDVFGQVVSVQNHHKQPIVKHDTVYAGEDVSQKLIRTTTELKRVGATATVISALDEVAWQFNLRGADIPYNPFFKSYAIIYADYNDRQPKLFVNLAQLNSSIYPAGVKVFDYSHVLVRFKCKQPQIQLLKRSGLVHEYLKLSMVLFLGINSTHIIIEFTCTTYKSTKEFSRTTRNERLSNTRCCCTNETYWMD